jgi:hypothetical protein
MNSNKNNNCPLCNTIIEQLIILYKDKIILEDTCNNCNYQKTIELKLITEDKELL